MFFVSCDQNFLAKVAEKFCKFGGFFDSITFNLLPLIMAAFDNIWKNLGYCEQYFSNKIGQRCGGPKTQIKKPKKINKNATMGYPNFRKSKFLQK